jgi:hypothetical protein
VISSCRLGISSSRRVGLATTASSGSTTGFVARTHRVPSSSNVNVRNSCDLLAVSTAMPFQWSPSSGRQHVEPLTRSRLDCDRRRQWRQCGSTGRERPVRRRGADRRRSATPDTSGARRVPGAHELTLWHPEAMESVRSIDVPTDGVDAAINDDLLAAGVRLPDGSSSTWPRLRRHRS